MATVSAASIFTGGPAPKDTAQGTTKIAYGTAGFRAKAELLEAVMYRVGVLAALRSLATGKATGVCVTASHNQEVDNGSKVADPDGGMLAADWEGPATALANAQDEAEVQAVLAALFPSGAVPQGACTVLLGRDTRASSPALAANVARGVAAAGGRVEDLGLVTTPQLHWAVMRLNRGEDHSPAAYHAAHAAALRAFLGPGAPLLGLVRVDCADGVGARSLAAFAPLVADVVALEAFNTGGEGAQLNRGCGAEHVQKERALPRGVPAGSPPPGAPGGALYASFDGDADRVVLFFVRETGAMELLDGDKIAALLAAFIAGSLEDASLPLSLGVVQTAYANGAATRHLGAHVPRAELACVATGVKHLHHKALDYDIGIYFEANGHGTVLFSPAARAAIGAAAAAPGAPAGAARLEALAGLVNPAIGDALSDLLAALAVLATPHGPAAPRSPAEWAGLYSDVPSRMTKEFVRDRALVRTTPDEATVLAPAVLQEFIDAAVARVEGGRCFVRPSGTEDCVRVYAEGATQALADQLAAEVGGEVRRLLA